MSAEVRTKTSFAINLVQFCGKKTQHHYILLEEVRFSRKEHSSLVNSVRDFFKTFASASNCLQIPLPKPKVDIGSTKAKDNFFAQYNNDIVEHPNIQLGFSFRFGNNNSCVFSIKKLELHGNQFIPKEIVNINHREIHNLYKKRYHVANKYETIEGNYDA